MLHKIGVDQVIYPEYDMALRLVQLLTTRPCDGLFTTIQKY